MSTPHLAPSVPAPRPAVADPRLVRPDWTTGTDRNPNLLWLDKNEAHDPELNELTLRLLRTMPLEALNRYAECGPLYRNLARRLGLAPECLLLTAGSDGAIRSVFEAFIAPGDRVVHTAPTFAMYAVYAAMYGADIRRIEYEATPDGPRLELQQILEAVREYKPKLLCLPNPDSPTGTRFAPDAMRELLDHCAAAGTLALVDEAYFPFCPDTVLPWIGEYDGLVVARTFAKAWGLAGLRIGFSAAAPPLTRLLHKVRPMYEVNTVAVHMASAMLEHEAEVLASVARVSDGKQHFVGRMQALGFPAYAGAGNFLHVRFGPHADAVHRALAPICLYRRDSTDACLAGYSRFSATTTAEFQPVIAMIERVVGDAGARASAGS